MTLATSGTVQIFRGLPSAMRWAIIGSTEGVKVVGVGVGNEQVLRALQGLGVLSLGGKITGVNHQDVSVVLDADAGVGVLR